MKYIATAAFCLGFFGIVNAQSILFVNDNDVIAYNTDTVVNSLSNTVYNNFDIWSIPDSSGATPDEATLLSYDLVIWYCSTDGGDLGVWSDGAEGNDALVSYLLTGAPLWIIGSDILYALYGAGSSFSADEFAYDFLGLQSYDVQSYVDDGGIGVPQVDRLPAAPVSFPETITWIFTELWYVDGCTPRDGTMEFYAMGPDSYALAGEACMFHNMEGGYNVMSTFFDPALIGEYTTRLQLLEAGIEHLIGLPSGITSEVDQVQPAFPNPADAWTILAIELPISGVFYLTDATGRKHDVPYIRQPGSLRVDVSHLSAGTYIPVADGVAFGRIMVSR